MCCYRSEWKQPQTYQGAYLLNRMRWFQLQKNHEKYIFLVKELYSKQTSHGSVVTHKFHLELNMITSFFIYQMHKIRCISTEQIQLPHEKAVKRNKCTFLGNESFCLRESSCKGTVPTCVYDSVAECHCFFVCFF